MLQCKNCLRSFSSGINIGSGATVTLVGNKSRCPFCGSFENIPDGTFKGTVEGIVKILEQSEDPLKKANELFEALERAKRQNDLTEIKTSSKFSAFKKWLPDSPEKIAAYIAIIYTIIQLLTKEPQISIKYDIFINQYNQIVNIKVEK